MNAKPSAAPPRRRHRRRLVVASLALGIGVFALGVWWFSWWAPPTYTPAVDVVVRGEALDSAGHDARVVLLDDRPYLLHLERSGPSGGALLFFGALHSKDPQHPQQAELRAAWQVFRPTVALVEGRMSFFVGTATQGIHVFGEGATVYALAEDADLPIYTLEPPLEIELAALHRVGDRKQVALFRVLSGYMSARRGGPVSDFKINRLLHRRAAPLTDELPTIEAFDAYFAEQFPDRTGWRDLPEQAMWPGRSDTWLNVMATESNLVRDAHFVRAMVDLVGRGERVFVIAGRSHTVVQEPVLLESLGPAERGELSSARPWEKPAD